MASEKVLALAGSPASGKTTAAKLLAQHMGFEVIRTREIIAKFIEMDGRIVDDSTLQSYGSRLISAADSVKFCQEIVKKIVPEKRYVIDALRPVAHYDLLYKSLPALKLIYVLSPAELRQERYMQRPEMRESTTHGFASRETSPVEQESKLLLGYADAVVVNKDAELFKSQLLAIASSIVDEKRPALFSDLVDAVRQFHLKHGYDVGTGNMEVMSLRVGLIVEELGEIHACVSKGTGNIVEEHADLLYLLLGNCVTLGIDLETAFFRKHEINMHREAKQVGSRKRVSGWDGLE